MEDHSCQTLGMKAQEIIATDLESCANNTLPRYKYAYSMCISIYAYIYNVHNVYVDVDVYKYICVYL